MNLFDDAGNLLPTHIVASQDTILGIFKQWQPIVNARAGKSAHSDKQDGSPVTETDHAVEAAVQAEMAQHYPTLAVYGEESGYPEVLPRVFWMIDPIDGTKSFIQGVPAYTSMAALIQDGQAIASIIYNPALDIAYTARIGEGAYKDGARLDLTTMPMATHALCKDRFVAQLSAELDGTGVVCKDGPSGGGYGFSLVANGEVAARFNLHGGGYIHDYAPGALLVSEAGGDIIEYSGTPYTYQSKTFVACHPALSDAIRDLVPLLRDIESQRD